MSSLPRVTEKARQLVSPQFDAWARRLRERDRAHLSGTNPELLTSPPNRPLTSEPKYGHAWLWHMFYLFSSQCHLVHGHSIAASREPRNACAVGERNRRKGRLGPSTLRPSMKLEESNPELLKQYTISRRRMRTSSRLCRICIAVPGTSDQSIKHARPH